MTNRQVVEDWIETLTRVGIREAFERYAREDYKQHNPNAYDGREGAIAHLEAKKAKGAHATVQRLLSDGNLVLMHTHMKYTDGSLDQSIMDIWRIEDGKLAEHWDVARDVPEVCASPMF